MLYAKQVDPEFQEDDLFFTSKNGLEMNDDYLYDNVIIDGNREFRGITTKAYQKIKEDLWYEYENYHSFGFANKTDFIEFYYGRSDGKHYSKHDIHVWIEMLENEICVITALELITRKKWREIEIRGCMQREWQTIYVTEEISDETVRYIEMCYFNTGVEFLVYENEDDCYSVYVEDTEELKSRYPGIKIYEFDGYEKTIKYREV